MCPQLGPEMKELIRDSELVYSYLRSAVAVVFLTHLAVVCWLTHGRALLAGNLSAVHNGDLFTHLGRKDRKI